MKHPLLRRRVLAPIFAVAFGVIAVAACGSRGPLDLDVGAVDVDASATVDASDANVDAIAVDAPEDQAVETGPDGNPLVNCGQCLAQMCGQQILACLTDTTCRTTLQCVAQMCLGGGGGGLDPQCALSCAGGDPGKLGGLLALFTCVTQKCGPDCTSALGGLGGGRRDGG
jgi:predicted small lipoprotein YifL